MIDLGCHGSGFPHCMPRAHPRLTVHPKGDPLPADSQTWTGHPVRDPRKVGRLAWPPLDAGAGEAAL